MGVTETVHFHLPNYSLQLSHQMGWGTPYKGVGPRGGTCVYQFFLAYPVKISAPSSHIIDVINIHAVGKSTFLY